MLLCLCIYVSAFLFVSVSVMFVARLEHTREALCLPHCCMQHEGRIIMITQTFKRWMKTLFAWWPWKRSARVEYTPLVHSSRRNSMPEPLWYVADATTPQQSTAIAVEQELTSYPSPLPEPDEPSVDMYAMHSHHTHKDQQLPVPISSSTDTNLLSPSSLPVPIASPQLSPAECHLIFLRYLFERGLLNEGFSYKDVPAQYRHNMIRH